MFKSATFKLTMMFMGILLVISFFFSYNWYRVATDELKVGIEKGRTYLEETPSFRGKRDTLRFTKLREEQLQRSIDNITLKIIVANIFFVGLGAAGSYILAKKTLEPLEEAHELQRRFTADASHELRTPVAAMQAEIEVALRDKKLDKKQAKALLNSNLEELAKIDSLTNALLILARQDDLSTNIELHPTNVKIAIEKSLNSVSSIAASKKIKIKTDLKNVKAKTDNQLLSDLVVILLENAIKYSEKSSSIIVSAKKVGKSVRVSVQDKGIGIAPGDIDKIFDRFYRSDSSRTKGQDSNGHGLGLSIAKNLATMLQTTIQVESVKGKGSTFYFDLAV